MDYREGIHTDKKKAQKQPTTTEQDSSDEALPMMQNKFTPIPKMTQKQKDTEIEAWRNLWGYTPSEVKSSHASSVFPQRIDLLLSPMRKLLSMAAHQILSAKEWNPIGSNHEKL